MRNNERRRHMRYPHPDKIEYVFSAGFSGDKLKGVTVNISNSGLCLYLFNKLSVGQSITIKSYLPVSYRHATVQWIRTVKDNFFIAGLRFF
ncbi:MAG: PilZ domain-containing protein [Nitrospirota bacterium]